MQSMSNIVEYVVILHAICTELCFETVFIYSYLRNTSLFLIYNDFGSIIMIKVLLNKSTLSTAITGLFMQFTQFEV